ncbi:hypothetical protein, partial [Streptomyces sp. KLOTTS4A1]|uniref:hypothetical protein n=1 Tax=Streptomyces sp. KLOTTS4A1 TaxID=3390996 RepID=UPI0039F4D898
ADQVNTSSSDSLFRLTWQTLAAHVPTPSEAPATEVLEVQGTTTGQDVMAAVHTQVSDALTRLQQWLAADHSPHSRL